ncbi:MAG: clostripain-related cysteine peptidase [Candidatus Babeliales bacterium]
MKKIIFALIMNLSCQGFLWATNSWNIYLYMETGPSLHQAAFKNLNDMASHKPDGVTLYALLHYGDSDAVIYAVEKNVLRQLKRVPFGKHGSDIFIDMVSELEEKNPAEHHCVILWNHGYGILVPEYNEETQEWELAVDDEEITCQLRSQRAWHHKNHRGMMTNMQTKSCMDNEELIKLFENLSKNVFHKKIDVCGLDMCKGAMFEHVYQLRDYIDFLIGSQECELIDGWPYALILEQLEKNSAMSGELLATTIIECYKKYYQEHAPQGIFTQSALDVHYSDVLKVQLDRVAEKLRKLLVKEEFRTMLHELRKKCRAFCDAPMYIDCFTFLEYIILALDTVEKNKQIEDIQIMCRQACDTIKEMVIANAVGDAIDSDVHGVSLYHPRKNIDPTYEHVPFAQESAWFAYIKDFCNY